MTDPTPPPALPPPPPTAGQPPSGLDAWLPADRMGNGIGFAFLLTFMGQLAMALVTGGVALIAMGLSQLVYMLPAYLLLRQRRRFLAAKAVAIVAGIVFLLNAACTGILFGLMAGSSFH